mmetsp:Transcript_71869/g.158706  ORF Transcript_71869/g.158706 Transcript_71869/m.158706 type:complete len:216 (+) Transcript_71869:1050-1697(+)
MRKLLLFKKQKIYHRLRQLKMLLQQENRSRARPLKIFEAKVRRKWRIWCSNWPRSWTHQVKDTLVKVKAKAVELRFQLAKLAKLQLPRAWPICFSRCQRFWLGRCSKEHPTRKPQTQFEKQVARHTGQRKRSNPWRKLQIQELQELSALALAAALELCRARPQPPEQCQGRQQKVRPRRRSKNFKEILLAVRCLRSASLSQGPRLPIMKASCSCR